MRIGETIEEGVNMFVDVAPDDGQMDTVFCTLPDVKPRGCGRIFYKAATGTPLHVTPPMRTKGTAAPQPKD